MVMAFEEITPVGTETPLHLHRESNEVMYILCGEYSFKIGDKSITGGPGTCAFMPHGIPHAWKYSATETGRAFFIYTPGEGGKVFEESVTLQRPGPEGTTVDLQVAQLFHRYGWEIVGPPPF
jgi:mannose-6-phosphate isomerase-like protein (cupin superfamily)